MSKHYEIIAQVSYWTIAESEDHANEQFKKKNLHVHSVKIREVKVKS